MPAPAVAGAVQEALHTQQQPFNSSFHCLACPWTGITMRTCRRASHTGHCVQVLVSAVTLAAFGVTGAMLGGANVFRGGARVVVGGLAAMGITYGFGRIFANSTSGRLP